MPYFFPAESIASADVLPDPEFGPGFGRRGSLTCLGFPAAGLRSEGSLNPHMLVVCGVGRASAGRRPRPESLAAAQDKGDEGSEKPLLPRGRWKHRWGALGILWGNRPQPGKKHPEPDLAIGFSTAKERSTSCGVRAPREGRGRI